MSFAPDPSKWSQNFRTVTSGIILLTTIVGSAWGGASYVGGTIYHFAEVQTTIMKRLDSVQEQLRSENTIREAALLTLKGDITPKIERIEQTVQKVKEESAAAKQRVDDIKDDLDSIKSLAQQNLRVTTSHDADIKATRQAVAPKPPTPPLSGQ